MNNNSLVEIRDAKIPDDINFIRQLWTDYLTWGNDNMQINYGVHRYNTKVTVEQGIKMMDKFLPPNSRHILAFVNDNTCRR